MHVLQAANAAGEQLLVQSRESAQNPEGALLASSRLTSCISSAGPQFWAVYNQLLCIRGNMVVDLWPEEPIVRVAASLPVLQTWHYAVTNYLLPEGRPLLVRNPCTWYVRPRRKPVICDD